MQFKKEFVSIAAIAALVVGCSSTAATPTGATPPTNNAAGSTAPAVAAATSVTEWDYQNTEPSNTQWQKIVDDCATTTGIKVVRQGLSPDKLLNKVLLAAQAKQLPDLLLLDNPMLQQVADTGALAPLTDFGVDVTGIYPNLVDSGTYKGKLYGIAPGINGLALFYNKDMFTAAGLTPPTTWAEIESDAKALTKSGVYGMAFSAVGTEEGSWQFEPWLWGAGGDLSKLDSPEAVKALQFWTDLVNNGYASKSTVQWSQDDANNQFMAGKAAMQENGPWNLPAIEASKINFGVVPIPMENGGTAPGPMGGEVLSVPVSSDQTKMAAAGKVINCLLSDKTMLQYATNNGYVPSRPSLNSQVTASDPNLAPFVQAAAAERSRTGPPANLGPNYSKVSQALWEAIQSALTGAKSPQDALTTAQQQAASAMGS